MANRKLIGLIFLIVLVGNADALYIDANVNTSLTFNNLTIENCPDALVDVDGAYYYVYCNSTGLQNEIWRFEFASDGTILSNYSHIINHNHTADRMAALGDQIFIAGYPELRSFSVVTGDAGSIWINHTNYDGYDMELWTWANCTGGSYVTTPLNIFEWDDITGLHVDSGGIIVLGYTDTCLPKIMELDHSGNIIMISNFGRGGPGCPSGHGDDSIRRIEYSDADILVVSGIGRQLYSFNRGVGNYIGGTQKCGCSGGNPACPQTTTNCRHNGGPALRSSTHLEKNSSWISSCGRARHYENNSFWSGISGPFGYAFGGSARFELMDFESEKTPSFEGDMQYDNGALYVRHSDGLRQASSGLVTQWLKSKPNGIAGQRVLTTGDYVIDIGSDENLSIHATSNGDLVNSVEMQTGTYRQPYITSGANGDALVLLKTGTDAVLYFTASEGTSQVENLTLTVTNYFNGTVLSEWTQYTGADFDNYRLWASNTADCEPNDETPDCTRELVIEQSNIAGTDYTEFNPKVTNGTIGYFVEVRNTTNERAAGSNIVYITQPECYFDDDCGVGFSCVAQQCVLNFTGHGIYGNITNETGGPVAGATVMFIAGSFEYTKSFITNSSGGYSGSLPTCPDYEVYVSAPSYGTTYQYYYDHWQNSDEDFTLFGYNLNYTVTDIENNAISGATLTATDVNDSSRFFTANTNSSGTAHILVEEGYNYTVTVSKDGYITDEFNIGFWDYGYQTDIPSRHLNKYAALYPANITGIQYFNVHDHLNFTNLESVSIRVHDWDSRDLLHTLSTDASGNAQISLEQGEYQYRFYKSGYQELTWYKNFRANNTLSVGLIRDIADLTLYNVTVLITYQGSPIQTSFRRYCSQLDGTILDDIVVTNSSGGYKFEVPEQSLCTFEKREDMNDPYSPLYFKEGPHEIQGDITFTVDYSDFTPYIVIVGDVTHPEGRRILGSTVTASLCNASFGNCTFLSLKYDSDPDSYLQYYFTDGSHVSLKAEKPGWLTGWDNFTANNSDSSLQKVRAIGLYPIGGECSADYFFNSPTYFDRQVLLTLSWDVTHNETIIDSGSRQIYDFVLANDGTYIDMDIPCGECVELHIEAWGLLPYTYDGYYWVLGLRVLRASTTEFEWSKMFEDDVIICSDQIYKAYNGTLDDVIEYNKDANATSLIGDPNSEAYDTAMGSLSETSLFGQYGRMFLRILGYDPNMSIFMIIYTLSLFVLFSILFVPLSLMWINWYRTIWKPKARRR